MAEEKTNVMRLLEQKKVPYTPRQYDVSDGALDGVTAANRLGVAPETCFKTLVTVGGSKKNHVFVIPVEKELDLKAAAKAVGEKSIEMIKQAQLLPLTGYVHGGCSPIGMKKRFPTCRPIFPAETVISSRVSAEASRTVGKRFFMPMGEQPPWT